MDCSFPDCPARSSWHCFCVVNLAWAKFPSRHSTLPLIFPKTKFLLPPKSAAISAKSKPHSFKTQVAPRFTTVPGPTTPLISICWCLHWILHRLLPLRWLRRPRAWQHQEPHPDKTQAALCCYFGSRTSSDCWSSLSMTYEAASSSACFEMHSSLHWTFLNLDCFSLCYPHNDYHSLPLHLHHRQGSIQMISMSSDLHQVNWIPTSWCPLAWLAVF